MQKISELVEEMQGRVMARSYWAERQKIASGESPQESEGTKLAEVHEEMRGRVMARSLWDELEKISATKKKSDRPHYGRQWVGQLAGGAAGMAGGAAVGAGLGATRKLRGLKMVGGQLVRGAKATRAGGAGVGALAGAIPGAVAGDYLGLRKAYTGAGYKPPTAGQYAGRKGGRILGSVAGPVGAEAGEYLTQKHLQKAPGRLKTKKRKGVKVAAVKQPGKAAKALKAVGRALKHPVTKGVAIGGAAGLGLSALHRAKTIERLNKRALEKSKKKGKKSGFLSKVQRANLQRDADIYKAHQKHPVASRLSLGGAGALMGGALGSLARR